MMRIVHLAIPRYANQPFHMRLERLFLRADGTYPPINLPSITLDGSGNGTYSVDVPETGIAYYVGIVGVRGHEVAVPAAPKMLSIAAGAPIDLEDLIDAAVLPEPVASLLVGRMSTLEATVEAIAGSLLVRTAAVPLGGHRVVALNASDAAVYADNTDATAERAIGITTGAAGSGSPVTIQPSGTLDEPSWTWIPGPVFLGTNGQLTQTGPTTGTVRVIGIASTATRLFIDIQPALILS